jgi:hypothetical protein
MTFPKPATDFAFDSLSDLLRDHTALANLGAATEFDFWADIALDPECWSIIDALGIMPGQDARRYPLFAALSSLAGLDSYDRLVPAWCWSVGREAISQFQAAEEEGGS